MGVCAKDVLAIAKSQIGYKEKKSNKSLDSFTDNAGSANWQKFGRDLYAAGYYNGNKNGYEWCDQFVDWCFYKACGSRAKAEKMECQTGTLGAGCYYSKQYYANQGRLFTVPQVGDQVFFQQSGSIVHTGIVLEVSEKYITTIEGNKNNKVSQCTYKRSSSYINSYGRPKYDDVQWKQNDQGQWFYYSNGEMSKSCWEKWNGYWYWLKEDGVMAESEFIDYNGKKYYLKAGGIMVTGWLQINQKWYYFNTNGDMKTSEWVKSGSYWYWLKEDGTMAESEFIDYNAKKYYLKSGGKMATGWIQFDQKWYYFNTNGAMLTSEWLKWKNAWYWLKEDGIMASNETVIIEGKEYSFDSNGKMK